MTACLKFPDVRRDVRQDPVDHAVLSCFRRAAQAARAGARVDLERACITIDANPATAMPALVSALPAAFGRPVRVYGPNEAELTFDERWLLSAVDALRRNDTDSLHFLVARRVPRHSRRWLIYLLRRVTDAMEETHPLPFSNTEERHGSTRI